MGGKARPPTHNYALVERAACSARISSDRAGREARRRLKTKKEAGSREKGTVRDKERRRLNERKRQDRDRRKEKKGERKREKEREKKRKRERKKERERESRGAPSSYSPVNSARAGVQNHGRLFRELQPPCKWWRWRWRRSWRAGYGKQADGPGERYPRFVGYAL
ncbi:hypothetical protein PUN28_016001 [Cardiocondyla obscurior]|uniref:Uncharacterized protein n=1 Tax=Cardiocondyla obscurior TaxID=286306 RepID=A0AAW2EQH7_9HYME